MTRPEDTVRLALRFPHFKSAGIRAAGITALDELVAERDRLAAEVAHIRSHLPAATESKNAAQAERDRLREALDIPGKPPYRIDGHPPGIISDDDYDVTDEVLAALSALAARGDLRTGA